jgi:phosphatidylinositol glycan class M
MRWILIGGLLLRIGLYILSIYQDATPLKFTDIDYSVFSDAAALTFKGASPYTRSTYRYTPLLAYLNIPNFYIHEAFGKWVFGLADLVTGSLLDALLQEMGAPILWRQGLTAFWVLNPFVAIISMRGSAESILGLLILLTVYFHVKKRYTLSALVYGLSVHFKVFPIIYALPLWLSISPSNLSHNTNRVRTRSATKTAKESQPSFFSWERVRFGLISGCTFLALNALFYYL